MMQGIISCSHMIREQWSILKVDNLLRLFVPKESADVDYGIMIEDKWTQQQQPLMMATRIDEVIAIIRKAKSQDG